MIRRNEAFKPSTLTMSEQEQPGKTPKTQAAERPKIVELATHPRVLTRKAAERPPEAVSEDELLAKMKSASLVLRTRQEQSWNVIRDFSGDLLAETDEGEDTFRDLRTPREKLDSQRGRINQLRGRIQAAVRDGRLNEPDDVVPWYETKGEEENEYTKQLTLLKGKDVESIIKEYTPLVKQIEAFVDEEAMRKFLNSIDERTYVVVDLLQNIRQLRHDHAIFLQLFQKEKNPGFLKSFEDRAKGGEQNKARPSSEKRRRLSELEQNRAKRESYGAQMRWALEYNGAEITLERLRNVWTISAITDPKHILTRDELQSLGKTFSDLKSAPSWIRDIAREKGLI